MQVDWQLLTVKLRARYKALSTIARELSLDDQHLNRLARGEVAEPRFNSGMRLLDLAYDVLPEDEFLQVVQR